MKKISIFIVALFIGIMLLTGCRFSDDSGETISLENTTEEEKARANQLLGIESGEPTPTKCPDTALPTLWMNGKLYKVESIEESVAEFVEEDFIGTVESEVGYNKTPTKEMESNILPVGASVYKHRELEDTYVGIYQKNGRVYYYQIYENKK